MVLQGIWTIFPVENCPRLFGLGLGLVLVLKGNFPWGQLSRNRFKDSCVLKTLLNLLKYIHERVNC